MRSNSIGRVVEEQEARKLKHYSEGQVGLEKTKLQDEMKLLHKQKRDWPDALMSEQQSDGGSDAARP